MFCEVNTNAIHNNTWRYNQNKSMLSSTQQIHRCSVAVVLTVLYTVPPGLNSLQSAVLLAVAKQDKLRSQRGIISRQNIIHTVGPIWQGGGHDEEKLLVSCYESALALAKEYKLKIIAFPLISAGAYGYPKDTALRIATKAISDFLMQNDMAVTLVVFDKTSFALSEKLFSDIKQFIDDNYIDEDAIYRRDIHHEMKSIIRNYDICFEEAIAELSLPAPQAMKAERKLADVLGELEETFSQMLLRLIDEKSKRDAEIYKRANVDRRLFSKIRSDKNYKPSKPTVIAFAIALELSLDETKDLLLRAGFALSRSSKSDVIIEYFMERGIYNIFDINEALFAFEEPLLGV